MVKRARGALLAAIEIDQNSSQTVGTQLYVALRDLILSGGFTAEDRLPSTRTLARELGLSRTTVVGVFERLIAEGLIESSIGSGTFVSAALNADRPQPLPEPEPATAPQQRLRLSRTIADAVERYGPRRRLPNAPRAFITGLPDLHDFPMAQWARLSAKHWRGARSDVMGYGDSAGDPRLREAIATHLRLNRGITCEADQVFIVGGAQQAFQMIGAVLLNAGDRVWFENPGAIGARNSLIASGANLIPVPIDVEGLSVAEGLRRSPDFRLVFTTPSHQQPLGSIMSLERRLSLLSAAQKAEAWIIEDDYDGEFFFGRQPLPTLKSIDRAGRVIYVGTFSKSIFPSLRLGFMLLPEALADVFSVVSDAFIQGVPTAAQAVVTDFITEGHFSTHIRRMRRLYAERHAALLDGARRELHGLLDLVPAGSGLHTVGFLPPEIDERAAAAAAAAAGIAVSPLARYCIEPCSRSGLVIGFGSIRPAEIRAGVRALRGALEQARTASIAA